MIFNYYNFLCALCPRRLLWNCEIPSLGELILELLFYPCLVELTDAVFLQ